MKKFLPLILSCFSIFGATPFTNVAPFTIQYSSNLNVRVAGLNQIFNQTYHTNLGGDYGQFDSSFLFPRLNTAQRDSLTPTNGTTIYNTTLNSVQSYQSNLWTSLKETTLVNAKDTFGAVGDNSTDNLTNIQAALNYATNTVGGVVYLPSGEYRVNGSLNMQGMRGVTLRGDGIGKTRIYGMSNNVPIIDCINANNLVFEDLEFNFVYNQPSCALLLGRGSDLVSSGNHVLNRLSVHGQYTIAAVYSIATEVNLYKDCSFSCDEPATNTLFYSAESATNMVGPPITSKFSTLTAIGNGGNGFNKFDGCQFLNYSSNSFSGCLVSEYGQATTIDGCHFFSRYSSNQIVLGKNCVSFNIKNVRQEFVGTQPYGIYLATADIFRDIHIEGSALFPIYATNGSTLSGFNMSSSHWCGDTTGVNVLNVYTLSNSWINVSDTTVPAGRFVIDGIYKVRNVSAGSQFINIPISRLDLNSRGGPSIFQGGNFVYPVIQPITFEGLTLTNNRILIRDGVAGTGGVPLGLTGIGVSLDFSRPSDGVNGINGLFVLNDQDFGFKARSDFHFYNLATERVWFKENGQVKIFSLGTNMVIVSNDLGELAPSATGTNALYYISTLTGDIMSLFGTKQNSFTTGIGVTNIANVVSSVIGAGSNITLSTNGNRIDINASASGEVNTASNLGAGSGVYNSKSGVDLRFNSLVAGANISISSNANQLTIVATDTGEVNTASNLGAGIGAYNGKSGVDLRFNSFIGTNGISISSNGTVVVISLVVTNSTTFPMSDMTSVITTGTDKMYWKATRDLTLKDCIITLDTVSSSGLVTVNVKKNGTTIFSTKPTIDVSEDTSFTAVTPYVFSTTAVAKSDKLTYDIDVAGTGAKGLQLQLFYTAP